MKEYDKKH